MHTPSLYINPCPTQRRKCTTGRSSSSSSPTEFFRIRSRYFGGVLVCSGVHVCVVHAIYMCAWPPAMWGFSACMQSAVYTHVGVASGVHAHGTHACLAGKLAQHALPILPAHTHTHTHTHISFTRSGGSSSPMTCMSCSRWATTGPTQRRVISLLAPIPRSQGMQINDAPLHPCARPSFPSLHHPLGLIERWSGYAWP